MAKPEIRAGLTILEFADVEAFGGWLASQGNLARGIWLKLARKGTARPSVSKSEAVDAALCHGWIDGQQGRYDDENWLTRFTPRRRGSRWSEINRTRALELIDEGRMRPAGLAEIEAARADGRWSSAYAPARSAQVPPDLRAAFQGSPGAAAAFAALSAGGRYAILYGIASVRMPSTRSRKIEDVVTRLAGAER